MTTLTTFLLELPVAIRKVDVLGSWDNFQEAYPLEKDRQAGPGHWRGCHSFKDITCDGLRLDPAMRRNGALKMGGRYWYFYRLDGEIEHCDPIEPSTTACPLLPGQEVNVLEVPSEPQGCLRDFWERDVFTLDPNAKYGSRKPSVRPKPTPIPSETLSTNSLRSALPVPERPGQMGTSAPPPTATLQLPDDEPPETSQGSCMPFPSSSVLMAKIFKLRRGESAPEAGGRTSSTRRGPFKSFWRRSTEDDGKRQHDYESPNISAESQPKIDFSTPRWDAPDSPSTFVKAAHVAPWIADSTSDRVHESSPPLSIAAQSTVESDFQPVSQMLHEHSLGDLSVRRSSTNLGSSSPGTRQACAHIYLRGQSSQGARTTASTAAQADIVNPTGGESSEASIARPENYTESNCENFPEGSPFVLPIQRNIPPVGLMKDEPRPSPVTGAARSARPPSLLHDSRRTLDSCYRSSLDGQLSPHYLSQPESPSVRDFEEPWESESQSQPSNQHTPRESPPLLPEATARREFELLPMPQLPSPGFQGYSLPEADHASTLTLRKLPSNTFSDSRQRSPSSESRHLVQSWNDGSDQRHLTALDELVDDLGHLGRVIT